MDIAYPIEPKSDGAGFVLNDPEIIWHYGGVEIHYHYILYQQTSSVILQEGEGTLVFDPVDGTVDAGTFDWCSLTWPNWPATITLPGQHFELHPDGKTFQVDFDPLDVEVKCDDALERGYALIVGRKGFGHDIIGNTVEIILDPHTVNFEVTDPSLTIEKNWAYGEFEGHFLFFEIPETTFPIDMPAGWPNCAPEGVATVTIGWTDLDVYVYQYIGSADNLEDAKADVANNGTSVLDKMGLAFVDLGPETFQICTDGTLLVIGQGALSGMANLGLYAVGTTTIVLPERTVTITIEDKDVTVVIPAQTVTVSGQTVTIPDITLDFEGQVTIPDYTTTIVVNGQSIDVTIPGGTYAVSDQYVSIPDITVSIPGQTVELEKMPSLTFKTTLTLNYEVAGWTFTSISKFDNSGFTDQCFKAKGTFGAAEVSAYIDFDPSVPAYKESWLKASLDFAGVSFTSKVSHKSGEMDYNFTAEADPLKVILNMVDYCTGIQFKDLKITLSDISLCCGVTYDTELYFTKENGFEYLKFSANDLFDLCCGISFSASIKYGVNYKSVSITPKWAGIENCITVYGDVKWEDNTLAGWELKAWKIYCEFAECNKLTLVTALDPAWYNDKVEDVFEDDEFEYIKASFCGAGCCGGNWSLDIQAFFQAEGSLFGFTRAKISAVVPVMSNLDVKIGAGFPTADFSFGWTFKF